MSKVNGALIRKVNLFGAWCGAAYLAALFIGWLVVGGFFPLHRPSAGAADISVFFVNNALRVKLGMIIVMWGAAAFLPFAAALADYVASVEGRNGPLTRITTLAGYGNAMLTFYPPFYWMTAAFRSDVRSPDLTYLLNDIAWFQFVGGLSLAMPFFLTVATAVFHDTSPSPAFPRWVGYACVLGFFLVLPDQTLFFFKTGPFAWNGLIAFWMPVPVFSAVLVMMIYFLIKAASQDTKQPELAPECA